MSSEEELDKKAQEMAEKTLEKLPEAVRKAKIGKVKEGILARLKAKNGDPAASNKATGATTPAPQLAKVTESKPVVVAEIKPATPSPQPAPLHTSSSSTVAAAVAAAAVAATPAVAVVKPQAPVVKLEGIDLCGDEPWFADEKVRQTLRDKVIAAHKEQKISIGFPVDEIKRIWPGPDRILGAGAVLRLGGSHIGGYGETDIGYAYRHLSRALHPDKNPSIPEAPDAFKRLSDAADELRQGLTESRNMLRRTCAMVNLEVTDMMLERPQEALFAEASHLISAVLSLVGEGTVSPALILRASAAFASSSVYHCQAQSLVSQWRRSTDVLEILGSNSLRTAYDCSPKQFRAQFLCALNRLSISEAKENDDCVRREWQAVMAQYPELGVWRELREKIRMKVWSLDGSGSSRSKWDNKGQISIWAGDWRDAIRNIFASKSKDTAVPATDAELRTLMAAMWREIAEWAGTIGLSGHLKLFLVDSSDSSTVASQWSFVPGTDLLLIVGDGIAGITAEGVFLAKEDIQEEQPEVQLGNVAPPVEEKKPAMKVTTEDLKRVQEAVLKSSNLTWEQMWRAKNARNQRTRAPLPTRVRSRSPSSSSSSRSRKKRRRSRGRRR